MRKRPAEQPPVTALEALERALEQPVEPPVAALDVQKARAEHRRERERHEQRHEHAEGHHHRERAQELAGDAGDEDHRREDRHQRERRRDHREGDLAASLHRRLKRVGDQPLAVAVDVFEHHDRVVHHHAHEQQQREQRHRVERQTEEVHHRDRAEERHRDRGRDDERRAQAPQEQPDDERGKERAFDQVRAQRLDHLADEHRVVLHVVQLQSRRKLRPDLGLDPLAHARDDLDGVRVRHLDDADADRRLAVEARKLPEVRQAVLDLGDVAAAAPARPRARR
ncbi:MAG: hypothetical protein RML56_03985 [Burkholderiales bacterium]|nr:hypothetical protein [Burkholderiales bacterium]